MMIDLALLLLGILIGLGIALVGFLLERVRRLEGIGAGK